MNNLNKVVIILDISLITKEIEKSGCNKLTILYYIYKYIRETFPQVILTKDTMTNYYSYLNFRDCSVDENVLNVLDNKLRIIWKTLIEDNLFMIDPNPMLKIVVPETFDGDINFIMLIFYIDKGHLWKISKIWSN